MRQWGPVLRILSANLWNGRADPRAFADLVEAAAVDVAAVQECSPEQAEALARVLPHGRLDPARNHMGMGIALRNPAVVERVSLPGRGAWRARIDPEVGVQASVDILNLHFAAPHTWRPAPGLWLRPRQIRAFETYWSSNSCERCVLVGDFNATPAWPLYRRIASQFTDAAVAVARESNERAGATWGPWSGSPRLARIDHGFVRGVGVEDFQVVPVRGADHSAIVMDLASG